MPVIYNEYHTGIYNWIKQKNISTAKDTLRKDIVWFRWH